MVEDSPATQVDRAMRMAEPLPAALLLTRVDASRNMRRFYGLALVRSLWGEVGLARQWGRIGSQGKRRTDWHESTEAAAAELERLAQSKQRKGYR